MGCVGVLMAWQMIAFSAASGGLCGSWATWPLATASSTQVGLCQLDERRDLGVEFSVHGLVGVGGSGSHSFSRSGENPLQLAVEASHLPSPWGYRERGGVCAQVSARVPRLRDLGPRSLPSPEQPSRSS